MVRSWRWVGIGVVAVALAWGLLQAAEVLFFRAELNRARRQLDRGRYAQAESLLVRLAARWPGRSEIDYLLGLCEQNAGRGEAALAAWARVGVDSPFGMEAALRRAYLEMERGRFADAERVLLEALRTPRREAIGARHLLAEVLYNQLRYDEMIRLLEANWEVLSRPDWPRPADALLVLRSHLAADLFPVPTARIEAALDRAAKQAPGDDRVWLARANLATRAGRFDEAGRWLDACLASRSDDPAVWRARLDWAWASGRVALARATLTDIPADRMSPARIQELEAWFAEKRGDLSTQERALERLLEVEPGNTAALERLAELAARAGRSDHAAELRAHKAALDRLLNRYRNLYKDGQFAADAPEMADLAQRLGRTFEARAFLTLAARRAPGDRTIAAALARLATVEAARSAPGQTLADLLGLAPGSNATPSAPSARVRSMPVFRDDAEAAGLTFRFDNGESYIHQLPEMASGGIGLLDFDGDGHLDVYCIQGGPFPPQFKIQNPKSKIETGDRLFRNRGDGTFEDATERSGIAALPGGYGHGVTVGDFDNDGHPDLFLTRWRSYALYRNRGDGTFEDVTGPAGLGGDRDWPTSAAWADLDGDGDLDLYVCHYGVWDESKPRLCRGPGGDRYVSCDPHLVEARTDHLFRNDKGHFVDVTVEAGVVEAEGRGLGVIAADLDDDGKIDLYVANDGTANYLFRNRGGLRFEETAHACGAAASATGGYQAGMGVAAGDLDGDGRLDLAVTNFFGDSTTFFQNIGGGLFADRTVDIGLAAASRFLLGFGIAMIDVDDDGRLDLLSANGHVSDFRPDIPYAMPLQLLLGGQDGRLVDVSAAAGAPFLVPHLGRGLAAVDLDNDGRLDAIVVVQNEPLLYLHNQTEGGHSVTLVLEGATSNRDAVGARVTIVAGGRRWVMQRTAGGSYLSAGDPRLHTGLGDEERIERVEVQWPSGGVDRYGELRSDRQYHLREGP
jgi:tetratricopeptide (TPR) repeat protein